MSDISDDPISSAWSCKSQFLPVIRSGACADIGSRGKMEDVYVCVDDFVRDYALTNMADGPNAFYGVSAFSTFCLAGFHVGSIS